MKKICFDLSKPGETLQFLAVGVVSGIIISTVYELYIKDHVLNLKSGGTQTTTA